MELTKDTIRKIEDDLNLNVYVEKGVDLEVKNCWHLSTDGKAVDMIFYDVIDFQDGLNCIYFLSRKFQIVILSFVLMDNHIHFVLYGTKDECRKFILEFIRRTAMRISFRHRILHPLQGIPISCQQIKDQRYLKNAICYVVKNPTAAGKNFNYYDYPWSSGSLYFRAMPSEKTWCIPEWVQRRDEHGGRILKYREKRTLLKTHEKLKDSIRMNEGVIMPDEFVASQIVEKLFRTPRSMGYFMGKSSEEIEEKSGQLSLLTIPWTEMRQNKEILCLEMFGTKSIRGLDTRQRLKLARALKSKYNCSPRQIARLSGLVYEEVRELLK